MYCIYALAIIVASSHAHVMKRQAPTCHAKYVAAAVFAAGETHSQCLTGTGSGFVSEHPPTGAEITAILAAHNALRSAVGASDMMRMVWNAEIASSAQKRASQCVIAHEHDMLRIEPGKYGVGQNIAYSSIGYFNSWTDVVNYWAEEASMFDNTTRLYAYGTGHYSQIVWASSSMVGCGKSVCGNQDVYFCNYAPSGNLYNTAAYGADGACAACDSAERCSDNLCDCGTINTINACLNDGTLNPLTCGCTCSESFYDASNHCEFTTCAISPPPGQCTFWTGKESYCGVYANVPFMCPTLCSLCPSAAIDYTP